MINDKNFIKIKRTNGNIEEAEILLFFRLEEGGQEYIVYTFNEQEDDLVEIEKQIEIEEKSKIKEEKTSELDNILDKMQKDMEVKPEQVVANFEAEQKELRENLSNLEQSIIDAETEKVDMKRFLETIRECTDLKELTPAIVNTLIKRIEVHNSIVVDGVKRVPIDIHFTAVGLISLPDEKELLELIEEIKANPLKSA